MRCVYDKSNNVFNFFNDKNKSIGQVPGTGKTLKCSKKQIKRICFDSQIVWDRYHGNL